jgi:transposase-like protein
MKKSERINIIHQISDLLDNQCARCEKFKNNQSQIVCAGCPVFERLRDLGEKLDDPINRNGRRTGYQYTLQARALEMIKQQPVQEVARILGIKRTTIYDWMQHEQKEIRNRYTREFKTRAVKEIIARKDKQQNIADKYGVNITLLYKWTKQYEEHAGEKWGEKC